MYTSLIRPLVKDQRQDWLKINVRTEKVVLKENLCLIETPKSTEIGCLVTYIGEQSHLFIDCRLSSRTLLNLNLLIKTTCPKQPLSLWIFTPGLSLY